MMKIVLDTNVLLVSISQRSKLHWIFDGILQGRYILCVTTEILSEYAEIIEQHMGSSASEATLGALENLPNVEWINIYYQFHLLQDEDDNKFVDCAIAANADYIVIHDKDFRPLSRISFPEVNVVDTDSFQKILNG
ncbi:MAG: putative toxin-antitoxin system toxin component, PIN family [Saprospiraceae bacterium]|nr:putative toxin-antitoxin system toxin component, PIN family [Saprospiraceae bacterium]